MKYTKLVSLIVFVLVIASLNIPTKVYAAQTASFNKIQNVFSNINKEIDKTYDNTVEVDKIVNSTSESQVSTLKTLESINYLGTNINVGEAVPTFKYLAIGNSLTKHESGTGFWWNECGMAASSADKDYVHQLSSIIEENYDVKVSANAIALKNWEAQPELRSNLDYILGRVLKSDLDLVTIQLGDNSSDNITNDYVELVKYIQAKAPHAQIITIGTWMENIGQDAYVQQAANSAGVPYVSLMDMHGNPDYMSSMGATVYDEFNNEHYVNLLEVAAHPNDKGMRVIAEKVFTAVTPIAQEVGE